MEFSLILFVVIFFLDAEGSLSILDTLVWVGDLVHQLLIIIFDALIFL